MKDNRVSFVLKLPVFLAILYLIIPIDLLYDFSIPGLGYVDDIMILIWAMRFLVNRAPNEIKHEYLQK